MVRMLNSVVQRLFSIDFVLIFVKRLGHSNNVIVLATVR